MLLMAQTPESKWHSLLNPAFHCCQGSKFTDFLQPERVQGALQWFGKFDQVHVQEKLPKRAKKKDRRIKIAVLDTGIDLTNTWISAKRGRIQCWPTDKLCEDTDGHGTHAAYLLLRLAPHAQLRIAKVSKSQLLLDADVTQIAEVRPNLHRPDALISVTLIITPICLTGHQALLF
jgi:hypothetical protein